MNLSRREFIQCSLAIATGSIVAGVVGIPVGRKLREIVFDESDAIDTATRVPATLEPTDASTRGVVAATATPTLKATATETVTPPEATGGFIIERFKQKAEIIAEKVGLETEVVLVQLAQIAQVLSLETENFGSILKTDDQIKRATNPTETSGIDRYPAKKMANFILPEGGTGYISFGGGQVKPEKKPAFNLPNGVVDLSAELNLAQDKDYPYASQVYLTVLNLGAGPDVLPPDIPDKDLNGKITVRTNADLKNSYLAYGPYNAGGRQKERTIGIDWLAEQVWWATGGATNCGTSCGLARLVLVHEMPNPANPRETKTYLSLVDVTRLIGSSGGIEYRAQTVFGEEYTKAGVERMESFLSENVLSNWPKK